MKNIYIVGAGSIGTAIGQSIAVREDLKVRLLTIEKDVADSINSARINQKYFPNIKLRKKLKASTNFRKLKMADIIFLAIPSTVTVDFVETHRSFIQKDAILVNLAKGFGPENKTIVECLDKKVPNVVCTMKGPTFARELINNLPTAFTLGARNENAFKLFSEIFKGTNIYIDYSTDVRGVEILSILKNIYAIVIGVVDAHFDSPNLKFLVLTKAFNEMKNLLEYFGGKEKTIFNYCGIGDFALTALNDLSRNRTLGLLIGKGFFTDNISEKVVLEGRIAVNVFYDQLLKSGLDKKDYQLIGELYQIFNRKNYDISGFVGNILK